MRASLVVGNPNSGKSTLFNRLTGLKQRIGNYPGVTVERHIGIPENRRATTELVDLPGTHSLSAHSLEEHIAVDVIFGRMEGTKPPDGILAVLDATNLYQGLFLAAAVGGARTAHGCCFDHDRRGGAERQSSDG